MIFKISNIFNKSTHKVEFIRKTRSQSQISGTYVNKTLNKKSIVYIF
ncbi:hypothetical protein VIBNIWn13_970030 [Vibrio nigripulchritudo Wn13]|nr:hypothetical protein VIBNIWn13_970030 [Vibrio nigripulchritudo Wn13]